MPQRVNSKSDIGNTKRASDVYDVNNCFLTDQGWVYRHFKGEPSSTERFWDEILVAGDADGDQIQYSTNPAKGSLLVENPSFEAGPDGNFDIMYSKHTENDVEFGDPANYVSGVNAVPPGPDPEGYVQFPSLDGSEVTANNVTAPQTDNGGVSQTDTTPTNNTYNGAIAVDGYYPLFLTRSAANAAGNGSHHVHYLNNRSYYMPNGVSIWHGNYNA